MTTSRWSGRAPVREARRPLDLRRWVLAGVVAETIGMTAASAAALTS